MKKKNLTKTGFWHYENNTSDYLVYKVDKKKCNSAYNKLFKYSQITAFINISLGMK